MENLKLDDPIIKVKGVGEKNALLLSRIQIFTVADLVYYFPRNYDSFEQPTESLASLFGDQNLGVAKDLASSNGSGHLEAMMPEDLPACSVCARIVGKPTMFRGRGIEIVNAKAVTDQGENLSIKWFHMPYLRNALKTGDFWIFRGRVKKTRSGDYAMEQPAMYKPEQYQKLVSALQPIYPQAAKVTSAMIKRLMEAAFLQGVEASIEDPLSKEFRQKKGLCSLGRAIYTMHFPQDRESLYQARQRIVFDEFYTFLKQMEDVKNLVDRSANIYAIVDRIELESVVERLNFKLTSAQLRVLQEIRNDLCGIHVMNRMLQGDVGSGKTIIAFLSMYYVAVSGYQCAMMAPTEVLATQHYEKMLAFIEQTGLGNIMRPILLTGSLTASQKKKVYEQIRTGQVNVIIGTHAVFQKKVEFAELAYVITDEQHRFGVVQRDTLAGKGINPHVLVMSATPIPRSLALILYAGMDISVIDEVPANRLPIKNCVVTPRKRKSINSFIEQQIAEGHQVYIICPLIDESESFTTCANVVDYTKSLKEVFAGKPIRIQNLHGQMKNEEKNRIMKAFADHEIDILISTTVIEVGIDVPNATTILIENAERFGLAQLHQLRGRVGRGSAQSYCILLDGSGNAKTSKRLEILNRSNDGFEIAREDLNLRGPGDFFGIRQSGVFGFAVADIYNDHDMLQMVSEYMQMENPVL